MPDALGYQENGLSEPKGKKEQLGSRNNRENSPVALPIDA